MFLCLRSVAQPGAAAGYLMDQLQFVAAHILGLQNTLCLTRRELGHSWGKPVQGHTDLVMPLLQASHGQLEAGTCLHSPLESKARSKLAKQKNWWYQHCSAP